MALRAAVMGLWGMEVGSNDASQLFGQTRIFDTLSDILTYQTEKLKMTAIMGCLPLIQVRMILLQQQVFQYLHFNNS